ncbi:MAG: MOSC domain-containing protein [Muriicola sp.]
MKVISTNIGSPTKIHWKGFEEQTGIFKYPTKDAIFLGSSQVDKDTVTDRKHHGGIFKACYLFSASQYPFWQKHYPSLSWDWGMFGENITIDSMPENDLLIGSVYTLGSATVQITIPREPCYKLGIRFKDQEVIKAFVDHGHPGTYVKVLQEGKVRKGDSFVLKETADQKLSIADVYKLLYDKEKNIDLLNLALRCEAIPERTKDKLKRYQKKGP